MIFTFNCWKRKYDYFLCYICINSIIIKTICVNNNNNMKKFIGLDKRDDNYERIYKLYQMAASK